MVLTMSRTSGLAQESPAAPASIPASASATLSRSLVARWRGRRAAGGSGSTAEAATITCPGNRTRARQASGGNVLVGDAVRCLDVPWCGMHGLLGWRSRRRGRAGDYRQHMPAPDRPLAKIAGLGQ